MDVKSIIEDTGLAAAELARRLEVSDGHIADLKSGRRRLTLKLAMRLELITGRTGLVAAVVARETTDAGGRSAA